MKIRYTYSVPAKLVNTGLPTPETSPEKPRRSSITSEAAPLTEANQGIKIQFCFGLCSDHRPDISEPEFQAFIDKIISPIFPNLSVSTMQGRWVSGQSGKIVREPSRCVEVLSEDTKQVHKDCELIAEKFKRLFLQDSVLRIVTRCQYYLH